MDQRDSAVESNDSVRGDAGGPFEGAAEDGFREAVVDGSGDDGEEADREKGREMDDGIISCESR